MKQGFAVRSGDRKNSGILGQGKEKLKENLKQTLPISFFPVQLAWIASILASQ